MLRYNGIFNSLLAVLLLASCGQQENKSDPVSTTAQRNSSIEEVIRLLKARNPEACTAALPLAATNVRKIAFQRGMEYLEAELQRQVSITGRDASFISYDSQEKAMTCRATFDLRWIDGSHPQPHAPAPDTFIVTLVSDARVDTRWGTVFPQHRVLGAKEVYDSMYTELAAAAIMAEDTNSRIAIEAEMEAESTFLASLSEQDRISARVCDLIIWRHHNGAVFTVGMDQQGLLLSNGPKQFRCRLTEDSFSYSVVDNNGVVAGTQREYSVEPIEDDYIMLSSADGSPMKIDLLHRDARRDRNEARREERARHTDAF